MRILLVAPEVPNLNATQEIRTITEIHSVTIYNGAVSLHDLYEVCRNNRFDIIHVISHSGKSGNSDRFEAWVELSEKEFLTPQDIVNLASLSKAKLIFLNGCDSSIIASYLTLHAVPSAIYTNIDLVDKSAWVMPMSFYTTLASMESIDSVDYHRAYIVSAPHSGVYGWSSSIQEYQAYILKPVLDKIDELYEHVLTTDANMAKFEAMVEATLTRAFAKSQRHTYIAFGTLALIFAFVSIIPDYILFSVR